MIVSRVRAGSLAGNGADETCQVFHSGGNMQDLIDRLTVAQDAITQILERL